MVGVRFGVKGEAAFAAAMERESKKILEEDHQAFVQKIVIQLFTVMVLGTPVDTGRARGSLTVEIGRPPSGDAIRLDKSGAIAIADATNQARRVQLYGITWIGTNLFYFSFLDMGSSSQARDGISAPAIATILSRFPDTTSRG